MQLCTPRLAFQTLCKFDCTSSSSGEDTAASGHRLPCRAQLGVGRQDPHEVAGVGQLLLPDGPPLAEDRLPASTTQSLARDVLCVRGADVAIGLGIASFTTLCAVHKGGGTPTLLETEPVPPPVVEVKRKPQRLPKRSREAQAWVCECRKC